MIFKVKEKGKDIHDQKGIQKAFYEFYNKLFEKKEVDKVKIKNYLQGFKLNKVSVTFKKKLNNEISTEEIYEAISALKLGNHQDWMG